MLAFGVVLLSVYLLILSAVVFTAAERAHRCEEMLISIDEYLNSKILASLNGDYKGIFISQPKEIKAYRERRRNENKNYNQN